MTDYEFIIRASGGMLARIRNKRPAKNKCAFIAKNRFFHQGFGGQDSNMPDAN